MERNELFEFHDGAFTLRIHINPQGYVCCTSYEAGWLDLKLEELDHSGSPPICEECTSGFSSSNLPDVSFEDQIRSDMKSSTQEIEQVVTHDSDGYMMTNKGWAYLRVLEGDHPVISLSKVHFVESVGNGEWLSLCGRAQSGKCQPIFNQFAREDEFCKNCVRILSSRERKKRLNH